jgi:hypothetical protein
MNKGERYSTVVASKLNYQLFGGVELEKSPFNIRLVIIPNPAGLCRSDGSDRIGAL